MKINYSSNLNKVDWNKLALIYEKAPLGKREPQQLKRAFEKSYLVCIAYHQNTPVAAGRLISDGEYYANIYDVAVLPNFQGLGIGKKIVDFLVENQKVNFILLTTTIGKEGFYKKSGFKKHTTAMAIYRGPQSREKSNLYLSD